MFSYKSILIKYRKSLLWAAIMIYLLFSPSSSLPKLSFIHFMHFDKVVHFIMFLNLQGLLLYDYGVKLPELSFRVFTQLSTIVIAYGAISEIIQFFFITGRQGSVYDFMADILGCVFAYGFFFVLGRIINRFPRQIL